MGTQYNVSVVTSSDRQEEVSLGLRLDKTLAEFNQLMSTYEKQSELSRFNQSESSDWFSVSLETAEVVAYALKLSKQTGGAYDPTVGPLVNLWGFGPTNKNRSLPKQEAIELVHQNVGYEKLEVRIEPPALRKQNPKVYLDLSSVAKGDGVDTLSRLLDSLDYDAYMIEIGGEVRTRGTKPGSKPWKIGIESPDSTRRSLQKIIKLSGKSVATSGDYRNYFEHDGVRYSHTIDPRTAMPVDHDLATVTVLADTCREADALATALLVLGPKAGYDWAKENQIAAFFVRRTEQGAKANTTPAWDAIVPTKAATKDNASLSSSVSPESNVLEPTS